MQRQKKALPVMDAMEAWMESVQHRCTPDDLLGKALDYAYKLRPRMRRYADDGRYRIDNNPVERGRSPTVMGRKNFLFSKTNEGAEDNAVIYSLPGSCEIVDESGQMAGIRTRQSKAGEHGRRTRKVVTL